MVWSLIRLGLGDDPRVKRGIDRIVRYQRFDDGDTKPPQGPPYDRYVMCRGKHTCHMGAVKALKALAEVPRDRRMPKIEAAIREGAEYLLKLHIYKKSHNLSAVDVLLSKQDARSVGKLENTFNGRFQTNIERKGEPSQWVTVHALAALKRFFGQPGVEDRPEKMRKSVDVLPHLR
jgi:hypothetical protein